MLSDEQELFLRSTNMPTVGLFIGVFICCCLAFFFSGTETAITNIKSYQWDSFYSKRKKSWRKAIVDNVLNHFSLALGAMLIGNTACNIVASSLTTLIVDYYWVNDDNLGLFTALFTGLLTFIVLVFAEYIPKTLARKYSTIWLNFFAYPLFIFYHLFFVFCYIFYLIFEREKQKTASEKDVRYLVDTLRNEGVFEQNEAIFVKNAMKFDDDDLKKIVLKDFIYLNENDNIDHILKTFNQYPFTRYPVLDKNKDCIGYVISREVYQQILEKGKENFKLKDLLEPMPIFDYKTKLDDVLTYIQRYSSHMLGVSKNTRYKKIIGIVTSEQIIERFVGNIYDEKDKFEDIRDINSYTWIVKQNINAKGFFKTRLKMNVNAEKDETMQEFIKRRFKIKRLIENDVYWTRNVKITILRPIRNGNLMFEVTKKNNPVTKKTKSKKYKRS